MRDAIALVGQDALLFDDTVAANIRFGRSDASDAEVEAAARAAAKLVDVVYEESSAPSKKPILSIAEAVERGSFYDVTADIGPTTKVHGDPDAAFAAAPHVLRGAKVSMPSQAHL